MLAVIDILGPFHCILH